MNRKGIFLQTVRNDVMFSKVRSTVQHRQLSAIRSSCCTKSIRAKK